MARAKKAGSKQATPTSKSIYSAAHVREVESPRAMTTLGPEHSAWLAADVADCVLMLDPRGHFFRLDPSLSASPELVAALAAKLRAAGAAAVKVLPRAADKPVAEAAHAAPTNATARQVVAELVAASRAIDKPALEALVESALSEAGL